MSGEAFQRGEIGEGNRLLVSAKEWIAAAQEEYKAFWAINKEHQMTRLILAAILLCTILTACQTLKPFELG